MVKVITYGTFDLFHEGHYRLLQRAKALGDYLIVGVTTEKYDLERGKLNVVDSLMTRIENVRKSGFADEIIIEEASGQKVSDVQKYHIDIFTVGSDWAGAFDYMSDYCKVVYLERTKNISSTMLREQNKRIQKIGIIGTGRIAGRCVPEMQAVSGINVQGVYNPHIQSAEKFAKKWEIETYADIEDFFDDVDAVYVASPHQTHYQYVKTSLEHGKHVLCEKPMVLKKEQAEELFAFAKTQGLILFEGIKTAYCPGFEKLLGIAGSGMIGNIKYIECIDRANLVAVGSAGHGRLVVIGALRSVLYRCDALIGTSVFTAVNGIAVRILIRPPAQLEIAARHLLDSRKACAPDCRAADDP